MLPDPPVFSSAPLIGWAILAIAAMVVVSVVLRVLRRAIKVSIRLAILIGALVLIAAGVCWLSSILGGGDWPFA